MPRSPTGLWGGGFLGELGVLDFAGGTVVHIKRRRRRPDLRPWCSASARASALDNMAPHNLVLSVIGASLLWVGWFGLSMPARPAAASRLGRHGPWR